MKFPCFLLFFSNCQLGLLLSVWFLLFIAGFNRDMLHSCRILSLIGKYKPVVCQYNSVWNLTFKCLRKHAKRHKFKHGRFRPKKPMLVHFFPCGS